MKLICQLKTRIKCSSYSDRVELLVDVIVKENKFLGKKKVYKSERSFDIEGYWAINSSTDGIESLNRFANMEDEEMKEFFLNYIDRYMKENRKDLTKRQAIAKIDGRKTVIEVKEEL